MLEMKSFHDLTPTPYPNFACPLRFINLSNQCFPICNLATVAGCQALAVSPFRHRLASSYPLARAADLCTTWRFGISSDPLLSDRPLLLIIAAAEQMILPSWFWLRPRTRSQCKPSVQEHGITSVKDDPAQIAAERKELTIGTWHGLIHRTEPARLGHLASPPRPNTSLSSRGTSHHSPPSSQES